MIIERLDLLAFGRFTNRSIDLSAGPRRFHIIYGPNESGKSTSLRALSDWLFGFQGTPVDDYVHKLSALRVGGRLAEPESEIVLECIRRKGNKDTLLGSDNKTKIPSKSLDAMLQGIDKESFKQQFGISHQQLVEGGILILEGKGDLSEILFSAGAGLGRLQSIRQKIAEQCKAIYSDRKSSSPGLNQLLDEWESLRTKLKEQTLLPATYNAMRADLARANAKAMSCATELSSARRKIEKLRSFQQAADLFTRRRWLVDKLEPLKNVTQLAAGFTETRRDLQSEFAVAEQQVNSLKNTCDAIDKQLAEIKVDDTWLSQEAVIERLSRSITQYEQSAVAIGEKQSKLAAVRGRMSELTRSIGVIQQDDLFETEALTSTARAALVLLANQYSGVVQRVSDADEKLKAAMANARKLKGELKGITRPESPSLLEDALRAVGQPQSLLAAQAKAIAMVDTARENANTKLHQLVGFDGTLEQAVALVLPPRTTLTVAATAIESARLALTSIENSIRQSIERRNQLVTQIEEHSTQSKLPDSTRLETLRVEQEQSLSQLLDASSQGVVFPIKQAIDLRDQVLELDRIHELRHEHHDHVLRRERDDRELQKLSEELAKQQAEREVSCAHLETTTEQWKRLWAEIGVIAGDAEEMRAWCLTHQELVAAAAELSQRCTEMELATSAVDHAVSTLQASIRVSVAKVERSPVKVAEVRDSLLFDDLDDDDEPEQDDWLTDEQSLASLFAHASKLCRELAVRCQAYESLTNRFETASEELTAAQVAYDTANEKMSVWQQDWSHATEPLKSLGAVTPASIDLLLKSVEEIARLRQDSVSIEEECQRLLTHQEKFRAATLAVVKQCAPQWLEGEKASDGVGLITQMLHNVKKQRENQKKRDLLLGQRDQAEESLREYADQYKQVEAQLLSLCKEANCESIDSLAACEMNSDERRGLTEKLTDIESSLMVLSRGESIESFEAEATTANKDSVSIDDEIETVTRAIEALEVEQAETQQCVGRLNAESKKMDGSDQGAELLQQQQSLLAKIRREADQYAKLVVAQDVLAKAIENYRRQNEGTVLAKAGKYFSRMTCEQYESLQVEFEANDKPKLFAIKSDDKSLVPADRLSDGTADALYLAMRIASLDVHLHKNHPIPLIIDDCLIQFDDKRALAALEILSELSLRTQVIMFTHHEHMVELSESNLKSGHFHLHRLMA